jgi:hypothetical protein
MSMISARIFLPKLERQLPSNGAIQRWRDRSLSVNELMTIQAVHADQISGNIHGKDLQLHVLALLPRLYRRSSSIVKVLEKLAHQV